MASAGRPITIIGLVLALVGLAALAPKLRSAAPAEGRYPDAPGAVRYDSTASATDRSIVEGALARARPEARAALAPVLGNVIVSIGSPAPGVAGETRWKDGRFTMELNLGLVYQMLGTKGTDRLVLHEFGHVVDVARTPPDVDLALDKETPRGYGCKDGVNGACAVPRERFAEGFSKWATGDIGAQAGAVLGYQILPPSDLERWGRDLTAGIKRP